MCFVVDPRLEKSAGERRLAFLFDSLRELDDKLDGKLLVVRGRPEVEIPKLARAVASTPSVSISGLDFAWVRTSLLEARSTSSM